MLFSSTDLLPLSLLPGKIKITINGVEPSSGIHYTAILYKTYFVSERGSQLDRPTEEIRTKAGPSVVLISGHHLDIEHNVPLYLGTQVSSDLSSLERMM